MRELLVMGASAKTGRAAWAYAAGLVTPVLVGLVSGLGLADAVRGVDAVYHLAPNVHPGEVGPAARAVRAAGSAGVSRFAFHPGLHPGDA